MGDTDPGGWSEARCFFVIKDSVKEGGRRDVLRKFGQHDLSYLLKPSQRGEIREQGLS
jgi:hypothetical protein